MTGNESVIFTTKPSAYIQTEHITSCMSEIGGDSCHWNWSDVELTYVGTISV